MRIAQPDIAVETVLPAVAEFLKAPKALIGGTDRCGRNWRHLPGLQSGDRRVLAHAPACDTADVDRAVKAAAAAFEGPWSKMLPVQRQR